MAGLRLHHSPQIVRTGELARTTTRGAREASVLALARCAAEVSAIQTDVVRRRVRDESGRAI